MSIKVRATERGYFGDKIRNDGDEFSIDNEKEFSKRWMEKVGGKKSASKAKEEPEGDKDPETLGELGKKSKG